MRRRVTPSNRPARSPRRVSMPRTWAGRSSTPVGRLHAFASAFSRAIVNDLNKAGRWVIPERSAPLSPPPPAARFRRRRRRTSTPKLPPFPPLPICSRMCSPLCGRHAPPTCSSICGRALAVTPTRPLSLSTSLYGVQGMLAAEEGYQVRRYSPLYRANYQSPSAERAAEINRFLGNGGYDFSDEEAWERRRRTGFTPSERKRRVAELQHHVSLAPSFARVFDRGRRLPVWSPRRMTVLTSAQTYSAGFDIAAMLVKHGAEVIGVPSAQAGNCFIDSLHYTLDHSGLHGYISFKWSRRFPNDPERGNLLRPDVELTYDYLARLGFDPNASVRLALEFLGYSHAVSASRD